MKLLKIKHIITLLLSVLLLSSCRAKKQTFNGASTLECADHEGRSTINKKKTSKWRLVLYKDGNKVLGRSKKGKSRLFKKKD
tara:strand:- start:203 stop:448 length:246 start_codon:yes stop_codon:yes gene_type:complete